MTDIHRLHREFHETLAKFAPVEKTLECSSCEKPLVRGLFLDGNPDPFCVDCFFQAENQVEAYEVEQESGKVR